MSTIRLTMAQALVKYLQNQYIVVDGKEEQLFGGMFAIFGHGNVAGMGEALHAVKEEFPTLRAHNEQGMALAAIAYAKQHRRQRIMAATTSIGPGAANMVTAAALAHANRLPVLLLPGDTFASRTPDPVLQQVENYGDPTITTNDCFRPVSRYFDRITRPEQIITSLPAALRVMLDPADCGPATLALPQDVQTMAFDYPESFFAKKVHKIRRPLADREQLHEAAELIRNSKKPLIIAGGGVHYSGACEQLQSFAETHGIPVTETQAGKGAIVWNHPQNVSSIGVMGSESANRTAEEADLIIAVGTRLQDFNTESRTLFTRDDLKVISLNVAPFDAYKHECVPMVTDARVGLNELSDQLEGWSVSEDWHGFYQELSATWQHKVEGILAAPEGKDENYLPTDANVLGAVWRSITEQDTVLCAAGGLPGELQKLWRAKSNLNYHLEYGYSCMGYEIAGGLGARMATPDREIYVMVGDGSYLMANSELATSVMLGHKIIVVCLDNRGYACINRLQNGCGGDSFNNLLEDCLTVEEGAPKTDFAAHAKALGADSEKVQNIAELEVALERARASEKSYLITLDTDPIPCTDNGAWWDVAVAEVSESARVRDARAGYDQARQKQPY